jgi:hypothetical protein
MVLDSFLRDPIGGTAEVKGNYHFNYHEMSLVNRSCVFEIVQADVRIRKNC